MRSTFNINIKRRKKDTNSSLIARFKRSVKKEKILIDYRQSLICETKGQKRRRKKKEGRKRQQTNK